MSSPRQQRDRIRGHSYRAGRPGESSRAKPESGATYKFNFLTSGIEPIMARAVAQRLRWKEALGLKDHFEGKVPASYKDAISAIELKMAEKT